MNADELLHALAERLTRGIDHCRLGHFAKGEQAVNEALAIAHQLHHLAIPDVA